MYICVGQGTVVEKKKISSDDNQIELLLEVIPSHIRMPLDTLVDPKGLLEIVLDLGRIPEARFTDKVVPLDSHEVGKNDIDYVVNRIGSFGKDKRAGIERTLHRISCILNRNGEVVGLTCRVGRAVIGAVKMVEDLVLSGKNILLLGKPGVGKTTMLREIARVLSDEATKRVIVVDTSNEIGGDGDIPHASIGKARRMQVLTPEQQHAVMIEAVENHMPEVIVIDEIGTEFDAVAARTIAERGVQLIGTAHGDHLLNLMMNPTLQDLVGGIQNVILSDEEARRRKTQKTVPERKSPPTFEIVVEIKSWHKVVIHRKVSEAVDAALRGQPVSKALRWEDHNGKIQEKITNDEITGALLSELHQPSNFNNIYCLGFDTSKFLRLLGELGHSLTVVEDLDQADIVLTTKAYYRKNPALLQKASEHRIPVFVLRNYSPSQVRYFLEVVDQNLNKDSKIMLPNGANDQNEVYSRIAEVRRVQQMKEGNGTLSTEDIEEYSRRSKNAS